VIAYTVPFGLPLVPEGAEAAAAGNSTVPLLPSPLSSMNTRFEPVFDAVVIENEPPTASRPLVGLVLSALTTAPDAKPDSQNAGSSAPVEVMCASAAHGVP
jgi:hypothetical protein